MIQSIFAGVSALQSFQTGIDVLANNISNVNTVGFKGSSTEFSNLFERNIANSNPNSNVQAGLGVRVSATNLDLNTGSYTQTDRNTDLAINGDDGWFGLIDGNSQEYFTRAGNFGYDAFGAGNEVKQRLVSGDGLFVLGTATNNFNYNAAAAYSDAKPGAYELTKDVENIDLSSVTAQGPLELPTRFVYPTSPTTSVSFLGNLGVEDTTRVMNSQIISPSGDKNNLKLTFSQTTPQPSTGISWDIVAITSTKDYNPTNGTGTLFDTQIGVATFSDTGNILTQILPPLNNNGSALNVDLGTGFNGIISNNGPDTVYTSIQDGIAKGELTGYTFNSNGEIVASFNNGKDSVVGRVGIYHFANDKGLEAVSGTKFRASLNSGKPTFYTTNNGTLRSNTLETSNVGLETALTELIIMQRSYDAGAKTITTADELLKNALQM